MSSTKEWALASARALGVLPIIERGYGAYRVRKFRGENDAFRAANPDMVLPSPALIQRTYGIPSLSHFDEWGAKNAAEISQAIETHCRVERPRVAEWGCGLGRIARHLLGQYDYTGFDIDAASIDWCQEHLGATFLLNPADPPLPAAPESFDIVFAVSIFTHLSAPAHEAWMAEIRRVLRPGGVFLFTVHGEEQSSGLLSHERAAFERGHLVVRAGVTEGSRTYLAYHPPAYVEATMLSGYEQLGDPVQACGHTLYAARKPQD